MSIEAPGPAKKTQEELWSEDARREDERQLAESARMAAAAIREVTARKDFGFTINDLLNWSEDDWKNLGGTYELGSNEELCARIMAYFVRRPISPEDTFETRREALRQAI